PPFHSMHMRRINMQSLTAYRDSSRFTSFSSGSGVNFRRSVSDFALTRGCPPGTECPTPPGSVEECDAGSAGSVVVIRIRATRSTSVRIASPAHYVYVLQPDRFPRFVALPCFDGMIGG